MTLDNTWFTEAQVSSGAAFSMKIKGKLHEEQTPYQHIEIYDTETFGKLMVIDGCIMLTDRDNFIYHEMMSHPALFTHTAPRNVVIIGGGDCGTMREVLKHPSVEQAWQIEIDERVTRLAEKYFPQLCDANDDPRAHFYFGDGVKWMDDADAGSIDIIIVDSTDPIGPAEGLFAEPFYRCCHRALAEGGILVQQSESPLYHLDLLQRMRGSMRAAGFGTLQTLHYPQCVYPSGWWSATLAGKGRKVNAFREKDAAKPGFETLFYTAELHKGAMALPAFAKKALES